MPDQPRIDRCRPTELAAAVPYAYAATPRNRSLLVFTAGACPLDESGTTLAVGDVGAQAEQAVANLARALHAAGACVDDVVKTTIYVASNDRADLAAAWRVVHQHFGGTNHRRPSSGSASSVIPTSWSRWRPSRHSQIEPGNSAMPVEFGPYRSYRRCAPVLVRGHRVTEAVSWAGSS